MCVPYITLPYSLFNTCAHPAHYEECMQLIPFSNPHANVKGFL